MTDTETSFPLHPVAEETLAAMPEVTARLTAVIEVPPYPLWVAGAQPWTAWDECVPPTRQACTALVAGWEAEARARLAAALRRMWAPAAAGAAAPVAEPVPAAENEGLTLAESGHTDPAAAPEGDCGDPGSAAVERVLAFLNSKNGPAKPDLSAVMAAARELHAENCAGDCGLVPGATGMPVTGCCGEPTDEEYDLARAAVEAGDLPDLPRPGTTYDGSHPGSDPRTDAGPGQPDLPGRQPTGGEPVDVRAVNAPPSGETTVIPAVEAATEAIPAVTERTKGKRR